MPSNRVIMAVGAIVKDGGGRILLVKHRPERGGFWQGRWIFPGGKLEPGESIAEGTRREVREETELEIVLTGANPLAERIVKDGISVPLHVLYITHMARKMGGKLRPSSDVGEARWVTKKELAQLWGELHEDTQAIARLANLLRSPLAGEEPALSLRPRGPQPEGLPKGQARGGTPHPSPLPHGERGGR